jgi:hypothetical protein
MKKKAKKAGKAKAGRKRSTAKDLAPQSARGVKGGSGASISFNYSKMEME